MTPKPKKWKPRDEQLYWYLNGDINWPEEVKVISDHWDEELGGESNYFRTRKEAQVALRKIKEILRGEG